MNELEKELAALDEEAKQLGVEEMERLILSMPGAEAEVNKLRAVHGFTPRVEVMRIIKAHMQ